MWLFIKIIIAQCVMYLKYNKVVHLFARKVIYTLNQLIHITLFSYRYIKKNI